MIRHTTTAFRWPNERDRYYYDDHLTGYAQVDTRQDAPYFGIWANPETRVIVCFCEGDVTETTCDTDAEFAAEFWGMKSAYGAGFYGIDPGSSEKLTAAFTTVGLQSLLH